MKKILLVFRSYRREIHQAIFDYALAHEWLAEYFPEAPERWRGDGILADYLDEEALSKIRGNSLIPVVMRHYCEGPRIGKVFGDIDSIAEMAVDYFQRRGFRDLAGIDKYTWEFDPCRRFVELAIRRGFPADHYYWARSFNDDDFARALSNVRKYVRTLPKPCGIFLGGMYCANVVFRACAMEKIRIPHEVAILTNDDDPLVCEAFQPRLSGISGEINHIGLAMARMLDAMMSDSRLDPPPSFIAPEKVITRQSTDVLAVPHLPTARAISFIFENYSKLIGVKEVSRQTGLSLNALQHNFLKYVGKAPSEFLREMRMNRAKELLEETELTLEQIARQTGYSCAMTFYTAFKRVFKVTPGSYRSQTRADQTLQAKGRRAETRKE